MARIFWYVLIFLQIVLLVVAAGAVALCIQLFGVPGLGPSAMQVLERRNSLTQQLAQQRSENKYLESFQKMGAEGVRRIAQLQNQIEILHTILPKQPATEQFTRTISGVGARNVVRIQSLAALPQKLHDSYVELPYEVKVEGSYGSLAKFFDEISRPRRMVSISKTLLQPAEGPGVKDGSLGTLRTVSASCVMTIYSDKPQPR